jgi:hypothetical protein
VLNGHSIVTIADGKVGNKALRLSGVPGGYPNQGNFVAINPNKKYRVRFWARPSANATGVLYFSLRQFTSDNAGSPGPDNGGRSPYKPGNVSRAQHVGLYGDTWGEYNYVWTSSDWQSGVKYFQPEFLDNYSGGVGYWDIQGFTIFDITDIDVVSAAVQTLATTTAGPDGLTAQYTVKIDNNGYVTGYGLSSTTNNGTPTSEFLVRADRFAIAAVGQTAIVPFIVQTSPTTINGVSVPAGVFINDAYIRNGTITNAKIANAAIDDAKIASLSADKITAGSIDTARLTIDNVTLDSYFDASINRNRLRIRDLGVDTAKIGNAAITTAKIGDLAVSTLKIAGNAVTQPQTYTASDKYVSGAITEVTGGYVYVGFPNGDYVYSYDFNSFIYVGSGNGDYTFSTTTSVTGGITAIETPTVTIGVDSLAAVQVVFYATVDGSANNDAGQHLFMYIDSGAGYQLVTKTLVGTRTASGNTYASIPAVMTYTANNLQTARVKVITGTRRIDGATGTGSNPSFLRNITISMLGAKR